MGETLSLGEEKIGTKQDRKQVLLEKYSESQGKASSRRLENEDQCWGLCTHHPHLSTFLYGLLGSL